MATRTLIRQLNKISSSFNAVRRLTTKSTAANRVINQNSYYVTKTSKSGNNVQFLKQYSTKISENNIPVVTYEEVKKLTNQSKQLLIDVREPKELQETGKIGPSINIPLGQLEQELGAEVDKLVFKAKYGCDKPEKNSEIIFHCRSGKRAQEAAELARVLGYKNVKNYWGSWLEWAEKEGLPK